MLINTTTFNVTFVGGGGEGKKNHYGEPLNRALHLKCVLTCPKLIGYGEKVQLLGIIITSLIDIRNSY